MAKYGPQFMKEIVLTTQDSVVLNVGDDIVIPFDESQIQKITLPTGLFSPSGKGVHERTSRNKDGLVRSATAFNCGQGDIVFVGMDGAERGVSCLVRELPEK